MNQIWSANVIAHVIDRNVKCEMRAWRNERAMTNPSHTYSKSLAGKSRILPFPFHCLILNGDENGHPSLLDPSQAVEVVVMEFTFQIIVQWSVSNTSGAAEHHGADHR